MIKTIHRSVLAVVAMIIMITVGSCQNSQDGPDEPQQKPTIVGLWKAVKVDGKPWSTEYSESFFLDFKANGTAIENADSESVPYKTEGNYLIIFDVEEPSKIYFKTIFELSQDNQYLTIHNIMDGKTVMFQRVN